MEFGKYCKLLTGYISCIPKIFESAFNVRSIIFSKQHFYCFEIFNCGDGQIYKKIIIFSQIDFNINFFYGFGRN